MAARIQDVTMPTAPAENPRSYDLYLAEGPKRVFVKLTVHGITVHDNGLAWSSGTDARERAFADIAAIHLGAGLIGQSKLDTCRITVTDGDGVATADWSANGLPDDKQLPIYRDFVRDLHARLAAQPSGTIAFTAGFPRWRYNVVLGAAIFLGLLWFAGLITTLFLAPGLTGLGILIGGAFVLLPIIKLLRGTAPRSYTPDQLPAELLS